MPLATMNNANALQAARRLYRAVGDDHHAGVLRIADTDATAVMERDPGGAARAVEQRVDERPVRDRIGAIAHRFGLAVRACDRAGVEMIAPDHDRRLHLAARNHLVERKPEPVAIAEAYPADARGQALELDARLRHVEPLMQMRVMRHQLLHARIGAEDVFGVARQSGPAERADAAAKQR